MPIKTRIDMLATGIEGRDLGSYIVDAIASVDTYL
jgi:hypothetical protein